MSDERSLENDGSEPDLEVVQQDYEEGPPLGAITVPVRHDGPVTVHELPARTAISRYINTSTSEAIEVAPFDLKRKYLWVTCTQPVWIGHDKRLVESGEVGQIPAGVMLPLHTAAQTWCKAVSVAGILSYWLGSWAE